MFKLAVVGCGEFTQRVVHSLIKSESFEIKYLIPDESKNAIHPSLIDLSMCYNIKIKDKIYDNIINDNLDMILVLAYFRKVPKNIIDNVLCVNCHGGILPFWRGISCNLWAILNEEEEAGYSFHKMTDIYDDGDIYHVYKEKINDYNSYEELRQNLFNQIENNISDLLLSILRGECVGMSQSNVSHCYTVKIRPADGVISDWSYPVNYYLNLQYIMGRPHGTGIFAVINSKTLEMGKLSKNKLHSKVKINACGSVVYSDKYGSMGIWVKDGILIVKSFWVNNTEVSANEILKLHQRL